MTVQETKIKCGTSHVYEKYRSEISERIAYIEVYEHDFPAEIMAQMAELFQTIVLYETDDDFLNNDKLQCLLEDTFHKVNRYLDKHTTYVILQKIKQYKKIFKKYNYKGVSTKEGQKFYKYAEKTESDIVKKYYAQLNDCYKKATRKEFAKLKFMDKCRYKVSKFLKKEPFLPIDELTTDFKDSFVNAKNLLRDYQDIFPKIVSNGKLQSLGVLVFDFIVTWLIPLAISVPIICKIFNYINKNIQLWL